MMLMESQPPAIRAPTEATPAWLSTVLGQHGLLRGGRVTTVHQRPERWIPFASNRITYLEMGLSKGAALSIPTQVVLKFAPGAKELFFYQAIAPTSPPFHPACYLAGYNDEADITWLLLEDMSHTHFQTQWPLPPGLEVCTACVEQLARFHACWCQDPRLEEEYPAHLPSERSWEGRIELAIQEFPGFVDFMQERLSEQRLAIFERLLACPRQDWRPGAPTPNKTLLHGDAHFWNFLYPKAANQGRIQIIDWNMWDIGRATDDLAYMIALHWYPERRQRFEDPMLQHYLRILLENGVDGYDWKDLWFDYRLSAICNLFIPVWQWKRGIQPAVWWSHHERSFLAFEDLGCMEFLG